MQPCGHTGASRGGRRWVCALGLVTPWEPLWPRHTRESSWAQAAWVLRVEFTLQSAAIMASGHRVTEQGHVHTPAVLGCWGRQVGAQGEGR